MHKQEEQKPESKLLGLDDNFSFGCGPELECFTRCCRDINLFLTPYDILRIKRRLGISSAEFLRGYTIPLFSKEAGHPLIVLKMVPDETRRCPFSSAEGCLIYDDRPWSCRSFPLSPVDESDPPLYEIMRIDFCEGFGQGAPRTIRKWRDTQNVAFYEEMNAEWKKVTHHENFRDLVEGSPRDIFFLGSYNIDEFRNVVFKGDFLEYFDVEKTYLKKIRSQDAELLKFAFKWMRHVLFGEDILKER